MISEEIKSLGVRILRLCLPEGIIVSQSVNQSVSQ